MNRRIRRLIVAIALTAACGAGTALVTEIVAARADTAWGAPAPADTAWGTPPVDVTVGVGSTGVSVDLPPITPLDTAWG